jgi:hypothetical protein
MSQRSPKDALGMVGAIVALFPAVGIWLGGFLGSEGPSPPREWLDAAAGFAAWTGPSAVSLIALRASHPIRNGIWIGSGIALVLVAGISMISGVSLALLPGAVLLIVAGAGNAPVGGRFILALLMTLSAGIISLGTAYFLCDRACWYEVGPGRWEMRPYSTTISGTGGTGVCGTFASPTSAGLAAGVWLLPLGVIYLPAQSRPKPSVA